MRHQKTLAAIAAALGLLATLRLWPTLARQARRELHWRRGRLARSIRERLEERVSIVADMGRPPHESVIWTGLESEAEAVRGRLPEEFGKTKIVRDR